MGECWGVRQLLAALSGCFLHMDGKEAECSAGALGFERTPTATFAGPDIGIGTVPHAAATIVQRLARRADIAILSRFVGETLGTEEWTPLSVDAIAGSHVRSDVPICQPL